MDTKSIVLQFCKQISSILSWKKYLPVLTILRLSLIFLHIIVSIISISGNVIFRFTSNSLGVIIILLVVIIFLVFSNLVVIGIILAVFIILIIVIRIILLCFSLFVGVFRFCISFRIFFLFIIVVTYWETKRKLRVPVLVCTALTLQYEYRKRRHLR